MNRQTTLLTLSLTLLSLFTIPIYGANAKNNNELRATSTIQKVYRLLDQSQKLSMAERLNLISSQFLTKPYILGALGEGENALYDQSPRYRVDGFDCETFVDTVIAIALSNNVPQFQRCIDKIRYHQRHAVFTARNHFTDLDWNKNNQQQGFLQDITQDIKDANHQPVALIASAMINKPSWYAHLTTDAIKLTSPNPQKQAQRLLALQKEGRQFPISQANIAYIPLAVLFNQEGQANQLLFSQIPDGAIIEIIRPNWDLREQIGTHLNVSHLGFAFWKKEMLIFRQASSQHHQVIDVPLIEYLKKAQTSPTIKGINIQVIIAKEPYKQGC